eukprot:scaffold173514_cov16-Prasinocladus_malaysianus.AAC.1
MSSGAERKRIRTDWAPIDGAQTLLTEVWGISCTALAPGNTHHLYRKFLYICCKASSRRAAWEVKQFINGQLTETQSGNWPSFDLMRGFIHQ